MGRKKRTASSYLEEALSLVNEALDKAREDLEAGGYFGDDVVKHYHKLQSLRDKILAAWSTGDVKYARYLCYKARRLS